jgi:hypothetical protein
MMRSSSWRFRAGLGRAPPSYMTWRGLRGNSRTSPVSSRSGSPPAGSSNTAEPRDRGSHRLARPLIDPVLAGPRVAESGTLVVPLRARYQASPNGRSSTLNDHALRS